MDPIGRVEGKEKKKPRRVKFKLKAWQEQARALWSKHGGPYKFIVVNSGTFTGKTIWGAAELLEDMWQNPGKTFWWVAAYDWQIRRFVEVFEPMAKRTGFRTRQAPHFFAQAPHVNGKPGAKLYGVTAKSVESLSAYHPFAIYGDEIAKMANTAWHFLRLRLFKVDHALFMSTPRPNFWRGVVQAAREHLDGLWGLVHVTTIEAEIVDKTEIEQAKRDLPSALYRQEILGEIVSGEGAVFRNIDKAITNAQLSRALKPKAGEMYVVGYDSAKSKDWGVMAVRKVSTNQVVKLARWREPVGYHAQAELVVFEAERYNKASIIHDATGPGGQHMNEELNRLRFSDGRSPSITGVNFDNAIKGKMVEDLVVRFEQEKIYLPAANYGPQYDIAVQELVAFEMSRSKSGLTFQYNAPSGMHDDCVTAIMLAFSGDGRVAIPFRLRRSERLRHRG